ncbi:MAG: family ATPase [Gammaproteobacteria bacterium]|jgi:adenylate kinase family enzyme|nr:family ATPase [Gammaproteobacteria bacterium]
MVSLDELGKRIGIIGCSSSGKSTLAEKLSAKLNIPAYHLDVLAHYPHSKWQRKSDNELIAAHNRILKKDKWIIDGNYSVCMLERIQKADSIIWLDMNVFTSACRYLVRSLKGRPDRAGGLPGAQVDLRLCMLRQILWIYPKNRLKYHNLIAPYKKLVVYIPSMRILNRYHTYWDL